MSFRAKLSLIFTVTIVAAVTLVTWGVSSYTQKHFEELDRPRTDALVQQFQKEFAQRADEVTTRVAAIADPDSQATMTMAIRLSRGADPGEYVNDATGLADSYHLDFLDIAGSDGSIISSKEYAARFGYKLDWLLEPGMDWNQARPFLHRFELPDRTALAITVVRVVAVGDKKFYFSGGLSIDQTFLAGLVAPPGMRAMFYPVLKAEFDPAALIDANGQVAQADRLSKLIDRASRQAAPVEETIQWSSDPASAENFHAIPQTGRQNQVLGILLVGSSRRDQVALVNFIRTLGVLAGGAAILLGVLVSIWVAARISKPIAELSKGAGAVAGGDWNTRVEVRSSDEIGQLAASFNDMTRQLASQRDKLVQSERVAAWRELARRLAHELKNPLFPLQLTIENLQRAREQSPEQFEEIFAESTATLRAELENLKTVIGRFSDFSKMPAPQLQQVNLNEAVRSAVRVYDAQFSAVGRPTITPELYLDESVPPIQADPDLLHRALSNLVLNSLDAMPAGGTLTVRTAARNGAARVQISDTGTGLTPEECQRLFTPYYTTKRHGTGLGLAVVQSVVSDHSGKITVESVPGGGATFSIELPIHPPKHAAARVTGEETEDREPREERPTPVESRETALKS